MPTIIPHDADDAIEGLNTLRQVAQERMRLEHLRRYCSNAGGCLESEIKHVRACSSRRDWTFRRGRARLRYRPVVRALGGRI